jgi:hypothetical protein
MCVNQQVLLIVIVILLFYFTFNRTSNEITTNIQNGIGGFAGSGSLAVPLPSCPPVDALEGARYLQFLLREPLSLGNPTTLGEQIQAIENAANTLLARQTSTSLSANDRRLLIEYLGTLAYIGRYIGLYCLNDPGAVMVRNAAFSLYNTLGTRGGIIQNTIFVQ